MNLVLRAFLFGVVVGRVRSLGLCWKYTPIYHCKIQNFFLLIQFSIKFEIRMDWKSSDVIGK